MYIGKKMSINANDAHKRGLLPISSLNRRVLEENNFFYPIEFFKWLCRKGYIGPDEFYHTGCCYDLTKFYNTKTIKRVAATYNLSLLYTLYKQLATKNDI